jgi:preprotein translocase subunit YajC
MSLDHSSIGKISGRGDGVVMKVELGDKVITPGGVGILCSIEDNTATVEMDYTYVVSYPLNEVKPYEV